jgi:3-deoxy-7-phosphoheptulonate synthase
VAVGADGVIVDVHPHPENALCDGPQALLHEDLAELRDLAGTLAALTGRTLTPAPGRELAGL